VLNVINARISTQIYGYLEPSPRRRGFGAVAGKRIECFDGINDVPCVAAGVANDKIWKVWSASSRSDRSRSDPGSIRAAPPIRRRSDRARSIWTRPIAAPSSDRPLNGRPLGE